MKIVEATWEKENLGVNCIEITIEQNDTIVEIQEVINNFKNCHYFVAKVPLARFDINSILSSQGFVFIEGSVNFQLNIKNSILSPLQHRLNQSIHYHEMDENDLNDLFFEIKNGLFKTDRIILDSKFTPSQSSYRYINWISTELKRKNKVYKILYKNQTIGFFSLKKLNETTYYPYLAGLYNDFINSGLGFSVLRKPIEEVIKRNGKYISTYASTNNPSIIRTHVQQGFIIGETQYVFVKHNL